jgi:ribosomal protein L34E
MKEVNCPNCNKKLGEINEEEMTITYENGVEPKQPNATMGMVVIPFTCSNCGKTHMQTIIL